MLKYDVVSLVKPPKPKGTIVHLGIIEERQGSVAEYNRLLNQLLRGLAKEVKASVIPAYKAHLRSTRDNTTVVDAAPWFNSLRQVGLDLNESIKSFLNNIFRLEGNRHSKRFALSVKAALGVDVSTIISENDLDEILQDYADANASLIKSLSDDTIKRVEQAVYAAKLSGKSARELAKDLQGQFGIMSSRAKLIAEDQLSKLNSDFNRVRQEQAGIVEYDWSTSKDERVRERHKKLEGKTYKWKEKTGAEEGLHPGKPIRCRCTARARVVF